MIPTITVFRKSDGEPVIVNEHDELDTEVYQREPVEARGEVSVDDEKPKRARKTKQNEAPQVEDEGQEA